MDLKAHIGRQVREARLAARLTQDELAEILGKSSRTISSIEGGHALISLSTLDLIAQAVDLPLSQFLKGYGRSMQIPEETRAQREASAIVASLTPCDVDLALELLRVLQRRLK